MSGSPPRDDAPGGRPPAPHTGVSRRTATWLVVVFLAIVVAAVMSLVHLPYAIFKPGPATNTLGATDSGQPLITVQGTPTYPTSGALDFTTVAVYGGPAHPVNVWQVLGGWLDPHSQLLPADQVFPQGVPGKAVQEQNAAQMQRSQQEAVVNALRALGRKVPEQVIIAQVSPDSPARSLLKSGDVLVRVAGAPVTDINTVQATIQKQKAGQPVSVVVRRGATTKALDVPTHEVSGHTVVGVLLTTTYDLPVDVKIHAGDVGGPSAGMMFGLGVYDKLTPGQLTGGVRIAGTGTLDNAGKVGPIGGIAQKMVGARSAGATWFLAPADNCTDVRGHIPDGLHVAKVSTFDQARAVVADIGSGRTGGIPSCTSS